MAGGGGEGTTVPGVQAQLGYPPAVGACQVQHRRSDFE